MMMMMARAAMMIQANPLCHRLLRTEPLLILICLSVELGLYSGPFCISTCCACAENAAAAQAFC